VADTADNREQSRIELTVGGVLAGWVDYRPAGESTIIAHTEILEGHEGEGLGGELVRAAVTAIVAENKSVIPTCPFAAAYIARHPELQDAVLPALRGR
jgi:predicted GNAT family acetyltransferase